MRSRRSTILTVLLILGFALAVFNMWCAAKRSLIPISVRGRVASKEIKFEKHPGRDDVCLLHLTSGEVLHIDSRVFEEIAEQGVIQKDAWKAELISNEKIIRLWWSNDSIGMFRAMPLIMFALVMTAVIVKKLSDSDGRRTQPVSTTTSV